MLREAAPPDGVFYRALETAWRVLPFRFLLETAPESPSCSFVLTVVVSMPLTLFFLEGGSFSSAPSPLSRELLRFGALAPFIPIGSRGERVRIIDIACNHLTVARMMSSPRKRVPQCSLEFQSQKRNQFQYIKRSARSQ